MPIKPKDSRLIGFSRVKARPQRLPKLKPIPTGTCLAEDAASGTRIYYNPPASAPDARITPVAFLPKEFREIAQVQGLDAARRLPPRLKTPKQKSILSSEQVETLRSRRQGGEGVNSLAKEFNVSSLFVSLVAPLDKTARQEVAKGQVAGKAGWSERKRMYREIRQTRRHAWGFEA